MRMVNEAIPKAVEIELDEASTLDSVSESVTRDTSKGNATDHRLGHHGWRPKLQMPRSILAKLKNRLQLGKRTELAHLTVEFRGELIDDDVRLRKQKPDQGSQVVAQRIEIEICHETGCVA